ncbi:MAG: alpha/beta fold hydrolase [Sphingobium sp.]
MINRRDLFWNAATTAMLGATFPASAKAAAKAMVTECPATAGIVPAQTSWELPPPQDKSFAGYVDVGDATLYYRDMGVDGPPVLFLHPATGCVLSWAFQEPAFAKAGLRMISYSRRTHYGSRSDGETGPDKDFSDLERFADKLKLDRFHLVGIAAGGFQVAQYALKHPARLHSLSIICSLGGISDPAFQATTAAMLAGGMRNMPEYMRELGPSFRAASPEGVAAWNAIEHVARNEEGANRGPRRSFQFLGWDDLEKIKTPALLGTGEADMYMPPSRLRQFASHMPHAEQVVFSESGHAPFWEQPMAFNRVMIDFLSRHG